MVHNTNECRELTKDGYRVFYHLWDEFLNRMLQHRSVTRYRHTEGKPHGNKYVRLFDKSEQIRENVCLGIVTGID